MAMLAEPRRKHRIGPNPRGKFFIEDEDNRGRQMLMKMGWKTGDGLGATSQGMNEPIKPKIHTDARGLGYDIKQDPWVAHNEEFEQLLKNLNSSTGVKPCSSDDAKTSSSADDNFGNDELEKKSRGSRSRIHYHKFVKNKDLSRASTKDIGCIFGKSVEDTVSLFSSLNAAFTDCTSIQTPDPVIYEETNESEPVTNDNLDKAGKRKKKKRRKNDDSELMNSSDSPNNTEGEQNEQPVLNEVASVENSDIKKKKKRHRKVEHTTEISDDNVANEHENKLEDVEQSPSEETIPLEDSGAKKKKKKRRKDKESEIDNSALEEREIEHVEQFFNDEESPAIELKAKKKKKSKKNKEFEDTTVNNCDEPDHVGVTNDQQIDNSSFHLHNPPPQEENSNDENLKKKKKSKKRKKSCSSDKEEEVLLPEPDNGYQIEDNGDDVPKKKKKKHKTGKIDPVEFVPQSEDVSSAENKTADVVEDDRVEKFGSLQFINRGSIVDYFRSKMLSRGIASTVKM